jgi:hypothetical protein
MLPLIVADSAAGEDRALEPYVDEILRDQRADSVEQLDPQRVRPEVLEELGFRVMDRLVDDREWHRWMNTMIGGEGSEELADFHRGLGRLYLERGGRLPRWERGLGGPGMMMRGHRRWFMSTRIPIPRFIVLLFVLAAPAAAGAVTVAVIRRRNRDDR